MATKFRLACLLLVSLLAAAETSLAQKIKTHPEITAADIREREAILASDSLMGRRTGQIGAEKARDYIDNQFELGRLYGSMPYGPETFLQQFKFSEHALDTSKHELTTGWNVIGYIPGRDPKLKHQIVIIGAHYDHLGMGGPFALDSVHAIHYGADDNASGVSGMLEIAEHLANSKIAPKRTVMFIAFSGEEEGLFGSDAFVNHASNYYVITSTKGVHWKSEPVDLKNVQAMLNMDMIGRMNDSNTLIVQGLGTSPVFRTLVDSLNDQHLHLKYFQTGTGPSDHASFYKKDVPVLFFFTGFHEDYHKATDTKEKINAEGEAKVATYVEKILLNLANRPDKIAFTRPVGDTEQKAASFGVYVGGVPDYGYDGDGVAISEVREHSPAEQAHLQKGDVIVGFDAMTIKTIYDYTNALAKHKPNDVVQFKIVRAGKTISVPVTLGTRSAPH